jgi:diguanylate cyclase (GGDEF)-like protein
MTSEAILRATSPEEVLLQTCSAAVQGGEFAAAAVFMAQTGSPLHYEAGAGKGADRLGRWQAPVDTNVERAPDLISIAFREMRPCIANDYANDERVRAWHEEGISIGIGAAIAMPIVQNGCATGVFLFLTPGVGLFDDKVVGLIERLLGNVAFALNRLEREAERAHVNRMISALSESNEAILRAETREKLFKLVCEAAIQGGRFTSIHIGLAEPESDFLRIAASVGPGAETFLSVPLATTVKHPGGRGLTGAAFRTQRPCISNDYLADQQVNDFHNVAQKTGSKSGAGLPLISRGAAVGAMLFVSAERNTFTPAFVELLERLAANLSFALENFDLADERKKAEDRIRYLATHDSLTDLPNRPMFEQLLSFSIKTATRYQRKCGVLFIDLDRFKIINDSLGHAVGDTLLIEVANRLRNSVRANDVVARLGGDEFMILLNEITESVQVAAITRDLLAVLSKPLKLCGHECRVTASIGVAMFPDDGADEQNLTKNADMAMYLAKTEGKNTVRFFSKELKTQSVDALIIESGLQYALDRNEFCLHYQPKLNVVTGQITGVEALLRWNNPEMGFLSPIQFISIAEETGLILPIGAWVLKTACMQNMAWQYEGGAPLSMAVNVSPRQFSDKNLLRDVDNALSLSGMAPELLQIEITESMLMLNVERAIQILDALQNLGVRIAIDDFGTGYSSMSAIKQFPIDTIKIDRSFISGLPQNAQDKGIAQAVISMSKVLGLTVIAEGVETKEQEGFLRGQACDEMQGFLFSKPVSADQMTALLQSPSRLLRAPNAAGLETIRSDKPKMYVQ